MFVYALCIELSACLLSYLHANTDMQHAHDLLTKLNLKPFITCIFSLKYKRIGSYKYSILLYKVNIYLMLKETRIIIYFYVYIKVIVMAMEVDS